MDKGRNLKAITVRLSHILINAAFLLLLLVYAVPASAQVLWGNVLPQVKQRCAQEWSEDYSMQAYCIEKQHKGWLAIGGTSEPNSDAAQLASTHPTPSQAQAQADASIEARFITTIEYYENAYANASNDMVKGGLRPERGRKLCSIMPVVEVRNWHGKVYSLSTNNDGNGVIELDLGKSVYVETMNNSFSDLSFQTLIPYGTALFNDVAALKKGQDIEFSGTLFRDQIDCFQENSVTVNGSMTEPEFLIRITSVRHQNNVSELPINSSVKDMTLAEGRVAEPVIKPITSINEGRTPGALTREGAIPTSTFAMYPSMTASVASSSDQINSVTASEMTAFTDGRNRRIAYESWFSSLTLGDYRNGVLFWAAHRSDHSPPLTCHYTSGDFEAGCLEAKQRLTPNDIRRKVEPNFKRGWNSL